MLFLDRFDAGRQLASRVAELRMADPVILALPRGGVPVGYEVARALAAPLEVILARKIGAPGQPEFAVGAIAEGGVVALDDRSLSMLRISEEELIAIAEEEAATLARRLRTYRGDRPLPDVAGRDVVLVDDGLATGLTAKAAVRAIKRFGPARVIFAAPVGAPATVEALGQEADRVVCVATPEDLGAVGRWYRDFAPVADEQVLDLLARARAFVPLEGRAGDPAEPPRGEHAVRLPAGPVTLEANVVVPGGARGVVIFAHGSGSSRHSPRNRAVARELQRAGFATVLLDLLTREEELLDQATGELRFDVGLLAERLTAATTWVAAYGPTRGLAVGYFGASTGAAAALVAAAAARTAVAAVVSRGGRPDLAGSALSRVNAPTLLIVGSRDETVLELNEAAMEELRCEGELAVVPGATHLFEEAGTLDEVARLAVFWFNRHLAREEVAART